MRKITDISYSDIGHPLQKLDLYLPECEAFPVFVYFHGGGLEAGNKAPLRIAEYLTRHNIAVVSANYRMYPSAVYPEFLRDAAQAVSWVHKHIAEYGNCSGIFVGGSSAGGYISMMLCFDHRYLAPYKLKPTDLAGFFHDAGQPTTHFNVLRERGMDHRRVVVDEAAPLYHIGEDPAYPPMRFIVSDNDMKCRYEQTLVVLETMKYLEYPMDNVSLRVMHGGHCHYCSKMDENGESVFAQMIRDFVESVQG